MASILEPPSDTDLTSGLTCNSLLRFPSNAQLDIQHFIHDPAHRQFAGPFTFVVVADPQFGLIEKYYLKKDNPRWDEEIRIMTAAIEQINKMTPKPKFVLVCGDMLDTRPGTDKEICIRQEQYADFMETLQLFNDEIKVVFVAGNHDVCDIPTPESIDIYRKQFGPDYFSFWVHGVKFTVLNSSYWKSPETVRDHYAKQDQFISTIAQEDAKYQVVFQHIPFFVQDPDEDDVSFLNIEKERRFPLMDRLEAAGVRYVFCGHTHRNGGGVYKNLEQVVTSALCNPLGGDPCGYRVVTVDECNHGIKSEFVGIDTSIAVPE